MTSCKKIFFGFGAILLAVFAITTSSDAQQKLTYSGAWVQEMSDGLEAIYGLQEDAGERLKKIEKSFQDQSAALGGDPSCKRVDCKALAPLIGDFARSDAAIRATQLLGHISVQQQGRLGDNTEKIAREIRRGVRTGERTLFWQNFALAAGELSLHIVAAMATGDMATLPEAVIGSVSNFLISKGTGYPAKIGEWTEQGAGAAGGGELTRTFAGTLSSQLTRFGGVSVSGDKMIFKPAFAVQGIAKTRGPEKLKELRRLKAIRALPNVVDASLQAIMRTVTAPSLNRTKKDLARNRKELQETMAAYRDFLVTVTYQKLYNKEYTYLRNEFRKLKDRADKLRQQCAEQVRTRACGDTLSAALDKAESDRSKAVGGANAKRKAATGRLTAARTRWGDMMHRVDETHRKLGKARARLAETKNLQKNRDRIRDLAFKAADADIRDKYRKQWDDLQTREPVAQQSAAVARLTRERADLWQAITAQRTRIAALSETTLAIYRDSRDVVNKAEASYAEAVSQARSKLIQCLGQREAGAAATSPTLATLRKETGNKTLIPYEILAPTRAAFESINKTLAKTRIRIEAVDGAQCNQVASRIDGCWFDVSNKTDDFKGEPVTIRTGGGEATLTYTKSGRRFSGSLGGDRLDVTYAIKSAAELADPHWWAGNQPPPGPVVRQAYTRYKIARKQISFSASAPDKLTGKHHGAYVRWGKTDKKMSSFETREYPERFVRGDKPKLRSIAFIDAGGKRRGSQSLSDSFRISAKGVSGCKAIVDTVRIKAYLDDDKDKFVWAQLRETGKDTLQFEGTISRLPALTSGRAQGSIRQVVVFDPVGLRGAAIKIVP